jgi:hypothetical protein
MSPIPPPFFEHPESFQMKEVEEAEEEAGHVHGPDCGHESTQHGDHIDYKVQGRHHFFHNGGWWKH